MVVTENGGRGGGVSNAKLSWLALFRVSEAVGYERTVLGGAVYRSCAGVGQ